LHLGNGKLSMKTRVAINGFGRIGRAFYKAASANNNLNIVAINDLASAKELAYLLKYDTAYGKSNFHIEVPGPNTLLIDMNHIPILHEADPSKLPWNDLEVDVVVESTGFFASYEKSKSHLDAGAKRVVISAPVKDNPEDAGVVGATVLVGVNEDSLKTCQISSNASCTTNAGSPIVSILDSSVGIEKAMLNTVHGYTTSQSLVDSPNHKDLRRGRAAALNIVPSSTGAAVATTLAHKGLEGKFDGIAMRVPVVVGSIVDITFISKRDTTVEEVNEILKKAAVEDRWKGIFDITEESLVSTDIIGDPHASIADLQMTRVVDGNMVKVLAWYDNETGYAHTLARHVVLFGRHANG
jgi:glyceraldehyde 3-phosphate dehydrogenase